MHTKRSAPIRVDFDKCSTLGNSFRSFVIAFFLPSAQSRGFPHADLIARPGRWVCVWWVKGGGVKKHIYPYARIIPLRYFYVYTYIPCVYTCSCALYVFEPGCLYYLHTHKYTNTHTHNEGKNPQNNPRKQRTAAGGFFDDII